MDIDSFSAVREPRWQRLKELSGSRRLTGAEADELTRLYQSTAGDLSAIRSAAPEPTLVTRLSLLLASSRVWLTGAHQVSTHEARRFLTYGIAAAFYRVRWWAVVVFASVVVLGALSAWWTVTNPDALALIGTADQRAQIAEFEFQSYYTEYDSTSFAATVWTNNGLIALQSIAFGLTGIYPLILMYNTVIQLGVAAAVMAEADLLGVFFQLIIPHGMLELSAVFVAAATGLRLFWAMLVPGARTRARALAQEGRIAFAVGIGLVVTLFVSGLIEGYITGSALPWAAKIVIGTVAFLAFWIYIFVVGRIAVSHGITGDTTGDFSVDSAATVG